MKIKRILNPVAQENTYILENDTACLVIDPGSDTSKILTELEVISKPIAAILLTHTHYDHIMSVEAVRQAHKHPPVYVAEAEKDWLMNPIDNLSGLPRHDDMEDVIVNPADYYFDFTKDYNISDFYFKVVPTPGHSVGGVSFIFDKEETVLVTPSLKKQLGDGTFQQVTTTSYSLVFKSNSSLFLITIAFSQVMDGTPLSVTKKSLTHIFHKKISSSLPFSLWQCWAF